MRKIIIRIGDPSKDGHNMSETYTFMSNKTEEEITKAYYESCKLTGLTFTSNNPEFKLSWKNKEYKDRKVCVDYEETLPSELAVNILKDFGINILPEDCTYADWDYIEHEEFIDIFLKFVSLSLTGFEFQIIPTKKERGLPLTIGYGLFY